MPPNKIRVVNPQKEEIRDSHRDNWEVMKPFVHFSFKAIKVIATGLIAIVKALPLLKPDKNANTEVKRR
jgi:hypothetical protein